MSSSVIPHKEIITYGLSKINDPGGYGHSFVRPLQIALNLCEYLKISVLNIILQPID